MKFVSDLLVWRNAKLRFEVVGP